MLDLALGHRVDLVIHVVDALFHQAQAGLEIVHVLATAGRYGIEHDDGHGGRYGEDQQDTDAIFSRHVGPCFHGIHAIIYARGRCSHQTK